MIGTRLRSPTISRWQRKTLQNLLEHYKRLDLSPASTSLVLSACVQMPSLPSIQKVEDAIGIPVVSAAVCTTYRMLKELNLEARVPGCGALLSGQY